MTTREEAIALAREAGIILLIDSKFGREDYFSTQASWPAIIRLIDLARAKENEACIEDVRTVGGAFAVECEALIRVRMK